MVPYLSLPLGTCCAAPPSSARWRAFQRWRQRATINLALRGNLKLCTGNLWGYAPLWTEVWRYWTIPTLSLRASSPRTVQVRCPTLRMHSVGFGFCVASETKRAAGENVWTLPSSLNVGKVDWTRWSAGVPQSFWIYIKWHFLRNWNGMPSLAGWAGGSVVLSK